MVFNEASNTIFCGSLESDFKRTPGYRIDPLPAPSPNI